MSTGPKTRSVTVEGVEFSCTEMQFCDAVDLLADMTAVVGPAGGGYIGGALSRGIAVGEFAKEVAGGKLTSFLSRVLSTTTMIDKGAKLKVDLLDSREKLNTAFTGRAKFVFPAVKLALEVSFKDFLDGLRLIGWKLPTMPTQSGSADSSPSTSVTG